MTPRLHRDDRGSAAPFAVVVIGVLVFVTLLVTAVAGAVADQRRTEAGADLGALAGAGALQRGDAACAAAAAMVRRNGATLARCVVTGPVVVVQAVRRTRPVLGHSWTARSTARAGPAELLR